MTTGYAAAIAFAVVFTFPLGVVAGEAMIDALLGRPSVFASISEGGDDA